MLLTKPVISTTRVVLRDNLWRGTRALHFTRQVRSQEQPRFFPAVFARGGTSNGLVIRRDKLPPQEQWHTVLPGAMGSPDPYGRQLNGMGSGISSTSKICVISPPSREEADVDFTFVQVGIKDGSLDIAGNCGNMVSIVGPVAFDEGLANTAEVLMDNQGERTAVVRIFNTNTSKIIRSMFKLSGNPPRYCPDGHYEMDGVPGKGSRVTLSFLDPAGAKTGKALPTGNPVDVLNLPDRSTIEASLVDVSNPGVFIRVSDLGLGEAEFLHPAAVEENTTLKLRLEQIRRAGAAKMGLDPKVESVPKIVLLFPQRVEDEVDIRCLALSMGQAHKAVPLTLALCLGAAASMPGTIASKLVRANVEADNLVIGHPSGKVQIGITKKSGEIKSAELFRTARVLMKGDVYY